VFDLEQQITIEAKTTVKEGSSISRVVFKINGEEHETDTTAPYSINWSSNIEGIYRIQAEAYNSENETTQSEEIAIAVSDIDETDLSSNIYRIRNMSTGKYLKSSGSVVIESDYVEGDQSLNWGFVETTYNGKDYYNIDSEISGILRASGASNSIPHAIISTGRNPPNSDVDKVWAIHYNVVEKTYRFEVRDQKRYLYNQDDSLFYNLPAQDTDTRSVWQLELAGSNPLSVSNDVLNSSSIKIYPNPAKDTFTILFKDISNIKNVEIYNTLGKLVYQNKQINDVLEFKNTSLKTGVYLVRAFSRDNQIFHSKLILK
jgi:hypothetical protein